MSVRPPLKYKKLYPKASIHAFEPFPEVFKKYVDSTRGDNKIYANNIALSDKNGEAKFFSNNLHYTNSLLPNNKEYTNGINSYKPLKLKPKHWTIIVEKII